MEINKSSDILGVITTEDIVEGRMVLLTSHPGYTTAQDLTGRLTDEPGVKLPDTAAEAAMARYVITWPVDNKTPPIVYWPYYTWALRQTLDRATNAPVTGRTIYLTYPGYQNAVTIPSGYLALAFGGGTFTVESGQYVYNALMQVPGTVLRACDTVTDGAALAGQLAILGSGVEVAVVERFTVSTFALTFRTLRP